MAQADMIKKTNRHERFGASGGVARPTPCVAQPVFSLFHLFFEKSIPINKLFFIPLHPK